jgi:hypothetical protein
MSDDATFERLVDEWAAADKECQRLHSLWNDACERRRKLARAKNEAWRRMNSARVAEYDRKHANCSGERNSK